MARITYVKKAQQRYRTVPVIDPETGEQKRTPVTRKDGTQKVTKAGKPVFLRVTVADKSQPLPNLVCEKCRKEIEPGQPYKHITPKSGPYGGRQRNRCAACPNWRPSETTSSTIKGIVYAAQENFDDAVSAGFDSIEDLTEAVHEVGESYKEAAEAARESATNIEDGFGHSTYQSDELNERADSIESAGETLCDWEPDDTFDEDDAQTEAEEEVLNELLSEYSGDADPEDLDALKEALGEDWNEEEYTSRVDALVDEKKDEALSNAIDAATDAITAEIEE